MNRHLLVGNNDLYTRTTTWETNWILEKRSLEVAPTNLANFTHLHSRLR